MIENREVMARNIKRNMEKMGVNATEICRTLGIKQNTFSDWLHAKTYPRIDKIEMMARYFGVSKADLVEDQSSIKEIVLSSDERTVIETMRNDKDFRSHIVKYAKMKTVYVSPNAQTVKKVARLKPPKDED
jgi:ribosome-binding protein aMBF1 (putative translation factor)